MTHPVAVAKFIVLPLELGVFGLPVVFAWTITPPEMSSLGGVAAIIISALFVGWCNVIAAKAAARGIVKPISEKLDAIEPLVTKIDAHVNSEKTRSEGEIATLKMQIDMQRETIADLKLSKELLAQAKAIADMAMAPKPLDVLAGGAAAASLENIDESTSAIKDNTAKTVVDVQELKKEGA